jgi:hypothetical protein
MGWKDTKQVAFPIACFCDIPLSRIAEHKDFYGDYGLGLSKSWGLTNKLEPVVYSPPEGKLQALMKYMFDVQYEDQDKEAQHNQHLYKLWSLTKPISGKMVVSGEIIEKEFYQENEWRYVAPESVLIEEDRFFDQKETEASNQSMEKYSLALGPTDIRYIFVKSDSEIPGLIDFINTELGHFPHNDLKILISRIVSHETLSLDL